MDGMTIESKFVTGIVSKVIKTALRKKLGYKVDVQLNKATVSITDGQTHVHLDADAELSKEELMKILNSVM